MRPRTVIGSRGDGGKEAAAHPSIDILATDPYASQVDWSRLHVFWGDERCVPPDDPVSNYRMESEALLERVPIPEDNVHRIRGEDEPAAAAATYERDLRGFFATPPTARDALSAWRVTLTPAVIDAAAEIVVLVSGGAKAAILRRVLDGPCQPYALPVQIICPACGPPAVARRCRRRGRSRIGRERPVTPSTSRLS